MDNSISDAVLPKPFPNIFETIKDLFNGIFRKNKIKTIRRTIRSGSSWIIWERKFAPDRTMTLVRTSFVPQNGRLKMIRRTFVIKPVINSRRAIG